MPLLLPGKLEGLRFDLRIFPKGSQSRRLRFCGEYCQSESQESYRQSRSLHFQRSVKAILSFVIVVLITLTLSNARLLRKSTLLDLVRLEKKMEKPIHPHAITAILGVGFLSAGYGLALDIMRGKQSLWNTIGFSPIAMLTLLCVVAGTILFMYSFLPYVCQKIQWYSK